MNKPKISIITPTFNQGNYIEETINSVLAQEYPNLEYVIIDGGSTDNTMDVLKKYQSKLSFWVSEKDSGQADAINKGLKHCTGEIFNWLNSDDYLQEGALQKIAGAFEDETVNMVAGKVRIFGNDSETIIQNQNLSAQGLLCWEKGVKFVQPGVWIRRELIDKCGGIDAEFHYSFDWDMYIRYLYHFPVVKEITDLLVHFRLHDDSKTISMAESFKEEQSRIIRKLHDLEQFSGLQNICSYKLEKESWTSFLKNESETNSTIATKFWRVFLSMPKHKRTAFTRQTAGALKAFILKREIN